MERCQIRSGLFLRTPNPSLASLRCSSLKPFSNPFHKAPTLKFQSPKRLLVVSLKQYSNPIPNLPIISQDPPFSCQSVASRRNVQSFAGRSKKSGGSSTGRIEGNAEFRRQMKRNARRKSKKLAESLFYRLKNPNRNYPDNFSEDELQVIGLGYDRMVRFMEKDDPNLRHPYDWYKYGQFGPYSWRGVVVGDPIRGRFSDERVTIINEVKDHEEWEKIEQFDMAQEFGKRLNQMDKSNGFRYFWVFVRHPRWRVSELPWQQWTLVSEIVVEAGKQRLDKWNLMGRLGNKARALITQCAAWMRPDIIYVKRPVYQCRFEPQDNFFKALTPFLDLSTEQEYLFDLKNDDGSIEMCTYFGGLCKIVGVNQKAFVDDVVNAYEKLTDEKKSKCLEFLLTNHQVQLLHPYTKEWKAKLEEMELGCDAPDDDDNVIVGDPGETEIVDWIEADDDIDEGDADNDDEEVVGSDEDDEDDYEDDDERDIELIMDKKEDEKQWEEEFRKATSSAEAMEKLAKRSVELFSESYKEHLKATEAQGHRENPEDGDEIALRGKRAKVSPEEWKYAGYGPWRKRIQKSKIPPELFLRAAVRPFTYRNLVKEIVLTRHAILDGDIGRKV
ncbi:EMB3120 protein [Quillaja saponaria]|uniref:EMB3120 protein n=1 Tax=Quillaja saponaria TaxID=32244 RepID=A0AAD7LUL7_QUISA|nr:EMB3120 protein [Quillaja saponaria]